MLDFHLALRVYFTHKPLTRKTSLTDTANQKEEDDQVEAERIQQDELMLRLVIVQACYIEESHESYWKHFWQHYIQPCFASSQYTLILNQPACISTEKWHRLCFLAQVCPVLESFLTRVQQNQIWAEFWWKEKLIKSSNPLYTLTKTIAVTTLGSTMNTTASPPSNLFVDDELVLLLLVSAVRIEFSIPAIERFISIQLLGKGSKSESESESVVSQSDSCGPTGANIQDLKLDQIFSMTPKQQVYTIASSSAASLASSLLRISDLATKQKKELVVLTTEQAASNGSSNPISIFEESIQYAMEQGHWIVLSLSNMHILWHEKLQFVLQKANLKNGFTTVHPDFIVWLLALTNEPKLNKQISYCTQYLETSFFGFKKAFLHGRHLLMNLTEAKSDDLLYETIATSLAMFHTMVTSPIYLPFAQYKSQIKSLFNVEDLVNSGKSFMTWYNKKEIKGGRKEKKKEEEEALKCMKMVITHTYLSKLHNEEDHHILVGLFEHFFHFSQELHLHEGVVVYFPEVLKLLESYNTKNPFSVWPNDTLCSIDGQTISATFQLDLKQVRLKYFQKFVQQLGNIYIGQFITNTKFSIDRQKQRLLESSRYQYQKFISKLVLFGQELAKIPLDSNLLKEKYPISYKKPLNQVLEDEILTLIQARKNILFDISSMEAAVLGGNGTMYPSGTIHTWDPMIFEILEEIFEDKVPRKWQRLFPIVTTVRTMHSSMNKRTRTNILPTTTSIGSSGGSSYDFKPRLEDFQAVLMTRVRYFSSWLCGTNIPSVVFSLDKFHDPKRFLEALHLHFSRNSSLNTSLCGGTALRCLRIVKIYENYSDIKLPEMNESDGVLLTGLRLRGELKNELRASITVALDLVGNSTTAGDHGARKSFDNIFDPIPVAIHIASTCAHRIIKAINTVGAVAKNTDQTNTSSSSSSVSKTSYLCPLVFPRVLEDNVNKTSSSCIKVVSEDSIAHLLIETQASTSQLAFSATQLIICNAYDVQL
jgi:hypothetical protein